MHIDIVIYVVGGGMYIYTETNSSSISGEAPEIITSQ